jgi:hypothetical protein
MEKLGKKIIVEQSTQNEWKRVSTDKVAEYQNKPDEFEVEKREGKYYVRKKQQSSEPKPSVTPIPIKDWMKSKTGQTKTTTSQYKRCENVSLQTKYCVSELIKKVQICLKDAGHNLGTSGVQKDGVDGYWGDLTDAALKTYGFGSGIDKQAVESICSTVDRIKRERVAKQLKDKADQEYQQKYGGMERASEIDYLYFGGENAGGGDEEASGEGMEGETLFFN